jgi:hypothetical protein
MSMRFLELGLWEQSPHVCQPKCRELQACSPFSCLSQDRVFAASGSLFLRNSTRGWLLLDLNDWLLGQVSLLPFLFRSRLWNEGLDYIRKWISAGIGSACMNTSRSRWLMI